MSSRRTSFGSAGRRTPLVGNSDSALRETIPRMFAKEFPKTKALGKDDPEIQPLTNDDLANPTWERMWTVYEQIARRFWHSGAPALNARRLASKVDDPELLSRVLPKFSVYFLLKIVVDEMALPRFNIRFSILDIIQPTPNRTRELLAELLKLLKTIVCADAVEDRLTGECKNRKAITVKRLNEVRDKEKRYIADLEQRNADEQTLRDELARRNQSLRQLFEDCEQIKERVKELGNTVEKLKLTMENYTKEYGSLMEQDEMLAQRVATSPESLIAERSAVTEKTDRLRSQLIAKRNEIADYLEKEQLKTAAENALVHLAHALSVTSSRERERLDKWDALRAVDAELELTKEQLHICRDAYNAARVKEQNALLKVARERDAHRRQMHNLRERLATSKKNFEQLRVRLHEKREEREKRLLELRALQTHTAGTFRASRIRSTELAESLSGVRAKMEAEERLLEQRQLAFELYVKCIKEGLFGKLEDEMDSSTELTDLGLRVADSGDAL